jgi:CRP-like cAMP-binding protein
MEDLTTLFSANNLPGHISYTLIAISYWLTDMFWLRVVAMVGLSMEILYFYYSGGDLRTGIGWDVIFIAINGYQLYQLVKDRYTLRLPEADRELLRNVMKGMNDFQIARLLAVGDFVDLPSGTVLATEQKDLDRLFFMCSGKANVTIGGRGISHLVPGNFVGEVAFLTGKPATATVIAETDVRTVSFSKEKLNQFIAGESEVASLIYQLLGRELADKMKVSNNLLWAASATA